VEQRAPDNRAKATIDENRNPPPGEGNIRTRRTTLDDGNGKVDAEPQPPPVQL
jgi:hypothetical protein